MNGLYGPDLGIHRGAIEINNQQELEDALVHPNKRAVQVIKLTTCSEANLSKLTSTFNGGSLVNLELCSCSFNAFPKNILSLSSLTQLSLRDNAMLLLPSDLNRLSNLQSLDISRNSLLSLSPSLKCLHNLRTLDISHNQIESIAYGLEILDFLETLRCTSNRIFTLPIGLICKPSFEFQFGDSLLFF